MTHYTSYEQITESKGLVIVPIVIPIPVGEPIPPEIPPGDTPETLDLPEGTESPASQPPSSTPPSSQPTSSGTQTSEDGGSCTKPTPAPQSPPVAPVSQTGVTATDPGAGTGTGTAGPTTTAPPTSTGRCPASSPTSPIPGCWGQPGCAYVIASDLGPGAACPANYCNCGGTNVPLLTHTAAGTQSLDCDYTTQPASNACPAGPTTSAPAPTSQTGFVLDPKAYPTVTGSACFSPVGAAPSGQKEVHTSKALDAL